MKERLGTLDILRFFAAAAVVFFHYGFRGTVGDLSEVPFPELYWPARYGFWGVELFFVISGFVIAASATGRSWQEFAAARAGRIYPAFFVGVTFTALILTFLGKAKDAISFETWLTNVTFLSPVFGLPLVDGVYWTLALELIFYGWIALFIAFGLLEKKFNWIIVFWMAICLVNEFTVQSKPMRFLFLTEYGPYFASGLLMQRMFSGFIDARTKILFCLTVVIGFSHPVHFTETFQRLYGQVIEMQGLLILHIGIYLLMGLALWKRQWVRSSSLVVLLGGLTYPLYLVHENAGFVLLNILAPVVGRWGALFLVSTFMLAVSWIIYRYVEPPGRRFVIQIAKQILSKFQRTGEIKAA